MTGPFAAILLFTDIVGSTAMWDRDGEAMDRAMGIHDEMLSSSIAAHNGTVFKHTGDGMCVVFDDAAGALHAAIQGQRHLIGVPWPGPTGPRVRMAIHAGDCRKHSGDYFGVEVCLARRILELTPGGSVLITEPVTALLDEETLRHTWLFDIGMYRLRSITKPIRVYRVAAYPIGEDLPTVEVA